MSRLVILRHGEKPKKGENSAFQLSLKGKARAQFIEKTYLGRGASKPVLGKGQPHVFFAITPHTIETASPSAESWSLPVTAFCTVTKGDQKDLELDKRTQQAAEKIRHALAKGKNVVAVWEHHRIADTRPKTKTTLRELLNLG